LADVNQWTTSLDNIIEEKPVIERLREYKELIAVIVFFSGGLWWIEDKYPTKTDLKKQVSVLECLLDKYMNLTQLQIRGRDVEKRTEELNRQISKALPAVLSGDMPPLSPAMKQELTDLEKERQDLQEELKKNKSGMQTINDELQRNGCAKAAL
jgi:cell division protein FtsB